MPVQKHPLFLQPFKQNIKMGNKPHKDILDILYPCFFLNRLLGYASFKIIEEKNAEKRIIFNQSYNISTTFLHTINTSLLIYFLQSSYQNYHSEVPFVKLITSLVLLSVIFFTTINAIFNKIHTKIIIALWRNMYEFDRKLRANGIVFSSHKLRKFTKLVCVLRSPFIIIYTISFFNSITNEKRLSYFLLYYLVAYSYYSYLIVVINFITFFYTIGLLYDSLIEKIQKEFYFKDLNMVFLMKCARFHQEICDLVRLVNKIIAVPILVSFGACYLLIVILYYGIICSWENEGDFTQFRLFSILWCVGIILERILLINVSSKCMSYVF